MHWYIEGLKKYAVFSGRARRSEFWFFALASFFVCVLLGVVDIALLGADPVRDVGLLSGLYALAVLVPSLAVSVRRLHDIDRSGWWLLLALIPVLGALLLLAFFLFEGHAGANRYGPDPKADERAALAGS